MIEYLFVYGTLAPGRANEHKLEAIGGNWKNATVTGFLRDEGWGSEMGYPGIELDKKVEKVEGFVFISENLSDYWQALDEFEGKAYQRVLTNVVLEDGTNINAYIYSLRLNTI